jgi:pilus assembly protein CpaB
MTTMRRRLLAGFTALALALCGAVILVKYVRAADERARADEEMVSVLVVDERVPAGADAITVGGAVSAVEVPARLVTEGVMTDLSAASGKVTTADLLQGEMLLAGRFVDPAELLPEGTAAAPDGTVEISLTLEPQRAVGGQLQAGDRVGVYVSTPQTIPGTTQTRPGIERLRTPEPGTDLQTFVVTRVASTLSVDPEAGTAAAGSPSDVVTVTLAVPPVLAPLVVAGGELGSAWLTLEGAASPADTTINTATIPSGGDK